MALSEKLNTSRRFMVGELAVVLGIPSLIIFLGFQVVGDNTLAQQIVAWFGNVCALVLIWVGLHLRGGSWELIGAPLQWPSPVAALKTLGLSVVIMIAALGAFILGAIVMTNVEGAPQQADVSGYAYLQGNLPVLIIALLAVYVVSSFGEEVIYRGFLIHRIEALVGQGKIATGTALLVSAVVFGLVHFGWGIVGVVQTTLMGLVLGLAYLLNGRRLWSLFLAHAYVDTLLLVQIYQSG